MRLSIVILCSLLFFVSCNQNKIKEMDYTLSDSFKVNFSIKYKNGDTVYFRKNFEDTSRNPYQWNENYYAILNSKQKKDFNYYLSGLKIEKYNSIYQQNFVDGVTYQFYFKTNLNEKLILVHSHDAPKELNEFSNWIYNFHKNIKLYKLKKQIEVKSENISAKPVSIH